MTQSPYFLVFFLLFSSQRMDKGTPSLSVNTSGSQCRFKFLHDCHPYGHQPDFFCLNATLTLDCLCPSNQDNISFYFNTQEGPTDINHTFFIKDSKTHLGRRQIQIRVDQAFLDDIKRMKNPRLTCSRAAIGDEFQLPNKTACMESECSGCKDGGYCFVNLNSNPEDDPCMAQSPKSPQIETAAVQIGSSAINGAETIQLDKTDTAISLGNESYCRTQHHSSAYLCPNDDCGNETRKKLEGSCQSGWRISLKNLTQFRSQIRIMKDDVSLSSMDPFVQEDNELLRLFVIPHKILLRDGKCHYPNGRKPPKNGVCDELSNGTLEWQSCLPKVHTFNISAGVEPKGIPLLPTDKTKPTPVNAKPTTTEESNKDKPWWMWLLIGIGALVFLGMMSLAVVILLRKKKESDSKKEREAKAQQEEGVDQRFQPMSGKSSSIRPSPSSDTSNAREESSIKSRRKSEFKSDRGNLDQAPVESSIYAPGDSGFVDQGVSFGVTENQVTSAPTSFKTKPPPQPMEDSAMDQYEYVGNLDENKEGEPVVVSEYADGYQKVNLKPPPINYD